MAAADGYTWKDFPHSSHRQVLEWLPPPPAKVLDVGTASGYLGAALSARGYTVVGIEKDEAAARAAAPAYAAFYQVDVASRPPLAEAPFEAVLCADVLEHLADPQGTLTWLGGLLTPAGRVIISVPNVAFVTVRLALLCGRFEYRRRGILDATHLRFFTRCSLLALLRAAGLYPRRLKGLPPPLPLVLPATHRWPLRVMLEGAAVAARVWPTIWAYQLVVEASR